MNGRDEVAMDLIAEQQRMLMRMINMPLLLEQTVGVRVESTPAEVVFRIGNVKLLHYQRKTRPTHREPVLFCYALINRPYLPDLKPEHSVVRQYLHRGFCVYMIDGGVPSYEDRKRTLKDYVCGYMAAIVQFTLRTPGCDKLHLLGYCMGGTMSTLFTAQNPELVSTLTLLATPVDFGGRETLLNVWTDRNYFDVDALVGSYGDCPPGFCSRALRA
jgi:polyhydroxyalkanoate synthase